MTRKEVIWSIKLGRVMAKLGPFLKDMTVMQLAAYLKMAADGDDFIGVGFDKDGKLIQNQ